jgi:hypothetical protein
MVSKKKKKRNAELMNNPTVEAHQMSFENQEALEGEDNFQYVAALGLDGTRVTSEVLARTPILFINGVRYEGMPDSLLAAIVDLGS